VDEGNSGLDIMRSGFECTLKDVKNGKAPEEDTVI
jgi:hypothetical protein